MGLLLPNYERMPCASHADVALKGGQHTFFFLAHNDNLDLNLAGPQMRANRALPLTEPSKALAAVHD